MFFTAELRLPGGPLQVEGEGEGERFKPIQPREFRTSLYVYRSSGSDLAARRDRRPPEPKTASLVLSEWVCIHLEKTARNIIRYLKGRAYKPYAQPPSSLASDQQAKQAAHHYGGGRSRAQPLVKPIIRQGISMKTDTTLNNMWPV